MNELLSFILTLGPPLQILLFVFITMFIVHQMLDYSDYKNRRQAKTLSKTMQYVETELNLELYSVLDDLSEYKESNAVEDQSKESLEIDLYQTHLQWLYHTQIKYLIKDMLRTNGYYILYKNRTGNSIAIDKVITQRVNDVYLKIKDSTRRSNKTYTKLGYNKERIDIMIRNIISRHVSEIDLEVDDVNNFANVKLGFISKLLEYKHEEV